MNISITEKKALYKTSIIAGLLLLVFFYQFFASIVTAIIFAVIFVPIYEWVLKKTKMQRLSMFTTIFLCIFAIIVPILLTIWVSVNQIQHMLSDISRVINSGGIISQDEALARVNDFLSTASDGRLSISLSQIESTFLNSAKTIGQASLDIMTNLVSSIPQLVTNIIVFFYVFVGLINNHRKVLEFLRKLNPLGDKISTIYLERAQAMTNSMVKGQFVVAIIQGLIGAISLRIAGVDYFTFLILLLTVLSLVPLGGGVITIPSGIILMLLGNISGGLFVLLTHFIVVANIDNYIRPKLVPKSLSLHPALIMISVFSGLVLFGFLGIVVGPVIFVVALSTLQIYAKVSSTT